MRRTILSGAILAGFITLAACVESPGALTAPSPAESAPVLPVAVKATKAASTAGTPTTPGQLFAAECGACHMPYPPGLLPARSWAAIMSALGDHFGEDASLDPDATEQLASYLAANAADAGGRSARVLRGLGASDLPLRITDTPWWTRAHDEVSSRSFQRAGIKSKSNCVGCHGPAAVRGVFEDD